MKMFYTYILYSSQHDRYYIGQTDNIEIRLNQHNSGLVKSTKAYLPWKLKYFEKYEARTEAIRRERFLKQQRNREFYDRLINSMD